MSTRRPLALLVAGVLLPAACSGGGGDSTAPHSSSTTRTGTGPALRWHDCGAKQCATLPVPLDPAQPAGPKIRLALARIPAPDPGARLGSIVINPGGPGAAGTDFVEAAEQLLPASITDRFDIVGWDPRGTGRSSPVRCGGRLDYLFAPDASPDDPAEEARLEAAAQRFARDCQRTSPQLLGRISSLDTARDLDRIRAALGEQKLNFLGLSYGSYLGTLYAQQFPNRIRAMVLDGAIDPAVPLKDVAVEQAQGFESAFRSFLDWCAHDKSCAFRHGGRPREAYDALRAKVERRPIRDRGRSLGPTQFDIGVTAPLYAGADAYSMIAEALHRAERGDPVPLLESFDEYVGRKAGGNYDPEWSAFLAISCLDGPDLDAAAMRALQARAAAAAPDFGAATIALSAACSFWPVPPVTTAPAPIHAPGAPPIVVVGTTGDPATPLVWAQGLARELGSARLVTVGGTTHTSSLDRNPCLDPVLVAYFVRLRPPARNLRCPA